MSGITPKCRAVSNYIIEKINKSNEGKTLQEHIIIKTKVQKILYICDIEYMKLNNGQPLFEDNFYAWTSGPVIPYIYYTFLQYQSKKIEPQNTSEKLNLTNKEKSIIDKVLKETQELDTVELVNITKIDDGPWHQVYNELDSEHNQIIKKEEIYNFYKDKELFTQPTINPTNIDKNIEPKDFTIRKSNQSIILEKDNQTFSISQGLDDDIYFSTNQNELVFDLNFSSRNYSEWQTYIVFEYLMKSIIGRYMLNGDNVQEYSYLPKDFIDLDKKIITWHSDSGTNNVLKLEYIDKKIIRVSLTKCKTSKEHYNNSVRIRTSGSNYEYYYQEFLEFFRHLWMLEQRLNKPKEEIKKQSNEVITQPKKRSLLKRFSRNNQQ